MAAITPVQPVKLLCGMISTSAELCEQAEQRLVEQFGPVDVHGRTIPFDFTDYYRPQMGETLIRRFIAFRDLVDPGILAEVKCQTNQMEDDFAAAQHVVPRPINLDPGYLALSRLILASMKDFAHRIYLGNGVYAEVTLQYRDGWQALPWTFPDYASGRYDDFLTAARHALRKQLHTPDTKEGVR
jgi:hypothetical protein